MELKVNEYQLPEQILFNYEELKAELTEKVQHYETLVYTDDQIKEAKADRATLNKLKKALSDERIRREREYMQPFNEFKSRINEIISIIDKPVAVIDKQIKEYEDTKKQEKLEEIKKLWSEMEAPDGMTLDKVFNDRMLNSSFNMKHVKQCFIDAIDRFILSGALLGESLKLSPSPQLGHYYLVPFNDREKGKVATFQLGYKGYIQLAIRSGQYKKLNVMAIKEGELEYFDPLNEDIKINLMVDSWDEREEAPTIGYYAFFELTNGFRKAIYWSRKQMESHAVKYSPGYKRDLDKGTKYTFWSKDFDGMAYKTMLRQLISKWGIMSIELQNAIDSDMAVINEDGTKEYVENDDSVIDAEVQTVESQPDSVQEASVQQPTDAHAALFGNN